MIKLFACDLDGTLYNVLHEADRTILSRLRRTIAAGRHVALATGRWARSARELGFKDLPIDLVCGNGAFVYDAEGALIRHSPIDRAVLEELLTSFPQEAFACTATDGGIVRGSREEHEAGFSLPKGLITKIVMRRMRKSYNGLNMRFDQTTTDVLSHTVCKVNYRPLDEGVRRELDAFLAEHEDALVNASFDGSMYELTAAGVDKGEAVAWLAARHGIEEDEVAAYGDGGNDLAMLRRFSHSYAPSDGSRAAREAASAVIGSNLSRAVSRHILATVRREGPLG